MMLEQDGLVVVPNFIKPETMALYFEEMNKIERQTPEGDGHEADQYLNMGVSPILEEASTTIGNKIKRFIEDYYSCRVGAEIVGSVVVAKSGYALHMHADSYTDHKIAVNTFSGFPSRDISTVLYFSDHGTDFTGGLLSYPYQDLLLAPAKGTLVAAPCSEKYLHEVTVVESGERLNIVTFWHVLEKFDSSGYV